MSGDSGRARIKQGVRFTAVHGAVGDVVASLRGRSASVLLLALLRARPVDGGVWHYGSSADVAGQLGCSSASVRESIALLVELGMFTEHVPASNGQTNGKVRISDAFWPYYACG